MFFKKKKDPNEAYLVAPISGKILPLDQVPDPVFSGNMMGDGIAIIADSSQVVAPANGMITLIAETKHAFGMTLDNGLELLVHVGLETVALQGQGFEALVSAGTRVKKGTPILQIDLDYMFEKKVSMITPIIILNHQEYPFETAYTAPHVHASEDIIFKLI